MNSINVLIFFAVLIIAASAGSSSVHRSKKPKDKVLQQFIKNYILVFLFNIDRSFLLFM